MGNRIVFIGGIHGVGKGTICNQLKKMCSIPHYSSSELLKWGEISSKENKLVENFSTTQERLMIGINEKIAKDTLTILDGHFCLLNKKGIPEQIESGVFDRISPIAIGIVTGDIALVKRRLETRDSRSYQINVLKKMQEMEIDYGYKISECLEIPFFEINENDTLNIINFIKTKK